MFAALQQMQNLNLHKSVEHVSWICRSDGQADSLQTLAMSNTEQASAPWMFNSDTDLRPLMRATPVSVLPPGGPSRHVKIAWSLQRV